MYGTQADQLREPLPIMFENDVKMYGTQASTTAIPTKLCLRMM